jgi:hypothetical protein
MMADNSLEINFTYNSPHEDLEKLTCHNANGTVNTKLTLEMLRIKLLDNVKILDTLIEQSGNINDLITVGYDSVQIVFNSGYDTSQLVDEKIVRTIVANQYNDEEGNDEYDMHNQEEDTNNDRLDMIMRITNNNDDDLIYGDLSDLESEEDSDNDPICDPDNINELISKYKEYINDGSELDNSEIDDI